MYWLDYKYVFMLCYSNGNWCLEWYKSQLWEKQTDSFTCGNVFFNYSYDFTLNLQLTLEIIEVWFQYYVFMAFMSHTKCNNISLARIFYILLIHP